MERVPWEIRSWMEDHTEASVIGLTGVLATLLILSPWYSVSDAPHMAVFAAIAVSFLLSLILYLTVVPTFTG